MPSTTRDASPAITHQLVNDRPRYHGYLADHPVVQDRLGEMLGRLQTALTTAYSAVHLLDSGVACDSELIGAKHIGHQLTAESAQDAMELHGARGLDGDYELQCLFRDIPHTYSPAGTAEFQRIHLAKAALGTAPRQWSEHFAAEAAWSRPAPDPTPA